MSIKIKASFTEPGERAQLLRLLHPLRGQGARFKVKNGNPYSHLYVMANEGRQECCAPPINDGK